MKTTKRYYYFEDYCLRTPVLPYSFYSDLTSVSPVSTERYQKAWQNKLVQEAVFLASPTLYFEIGKWLTTQNDENATNQKLAFTFLKYLSRMATRCTPFGLFAGCSMGAFAKENGIKLPNYLNYIRKTRFDMNFLVSLSLSLANKPEIKNQLLFYPNNSLYKAGNQLRYIEYSYENTRRIHSIEAVTPTAYLNKILENAKHGKQIHELAKILVTEDISTEEAIAYIEELVSNQILVSELEPSVSGTDFLNQLLASLQKIENTTTIVSQLQQLTKQLKELDQTLGNPIHKYQQVMNLVEKLAVPFDKKYLFQTDLFIKPKANFLSKTSILAVKKGMILLNKMTAAPVDTPLQKFKDAFVKRYEGKEIPLALALDTEMGIGYLQNQGIADDNPILEDLQFANKVVPKQTINWSKTQDILQRKLVESQYNKAYSITLTTDDFIDFEENWTDLPDSISTLAEVLLINGEEKISLSAVGGSSAANLLGRFCHGDDTILQHTRSIVTTEQLLQQDKIRAEIIHLPESRTGNILIRPLLREYEIPYLAQSTLPVEQQIALSDLMLSVRGNRILLRSKKYNKEVIPQLTNAHNYKNGLPIYQFLCDMQTQNLRSSIHFSWGSVAKNQPFLPRVTYENLIFSKATWFITKATISPLYKDNQYTALIEATTKWRLQLKMPQYVQLVDSDNTLLINMKNETSVLMLLQEVKNRKSFVLEEFLFDKEGIVKGTDTGYYTNQFVFSFYKELIKVKGER